MAGCEVEASLAVGVVGRVGLGRAGAERFLTLEAAEGEAASPGGDLSWEAEAGGLRALVPEAAAPAAILWAEVEEQAQALRALRLLDRERRASERLRASTPEERIGWLLELYERNLWPQLHPRALLLVLEPEPRLCLLGGPGWRRAPSRASELPYDDLVCLPPERIQGWRREPAQDPPASEAEGTYALAACALALLGDRLPWPAGLPAAAGLSERRQALLEGCGGAAPVELELSHRARRLFAKALSRYPGARPSPERFAHELRALLVSGGLEWSPRPARLAPTLAVGAGLLLLCGVSASAPGADPHVQAIQAYAAATHVESLAEQRAALSSLAGEQAQRSLPEARRSLALLDLAEWRQGARSASSTALVVERLLRDAVRGRDDELAQTLRFVAAFLQRWELGDEEGDAALRAIADDEHQGGALRALALASLRATPWGGRGVPGQALAQLRQASAERSPLSRSYPPIEYPLDLELAEGPAPFALEEGWIAELLLGRALSISGEHAPAVAALRRAHEAHPSFATAASLGLELVRRGPAATQLEAKALLEAAEAERPLGELALARARRAIADGRFDDARAAFQQAAERGPAGGDVERFKARALRGSASVALLAACAQVARDPEAALGELEALESMLARDDRGRADLRLAKSLALEKLGRRGEALYALERFLAGRSLAAAFEALPELDPPPATRASRGALEALLVGSVQAAAEEAVQQGEALEPAPWAARLKALEPYPEELEVDALLASAWLELARGPAARSRDENGYATFTGLASLEGRTPAQQASADRGLVYAALIASRNATDPSAALVDVLAIAEDFREHYAQTLPPALIADLRKQALVACARYRDAGSPSWREQARGLSLEEPRTPPALTKPRELLIEVLAGLGFLAGEGEEPYRPARPAHRLQLAELLAELALTSFGEQGLAQGLRLSEEALECLRPLPLEPEVSDLRKRVHLAAGVALLKASDEAGGPRALERAREHLCQAGGAQGAADWAEGLAAGFTPSGPVGRELSPAYWVARTWLAEARGAEGEAQQAAFAKAYEAFKVFAKLRGDGALPPGAADYASERSEAYTGQK